MAIDPGDNTYSRVNGLRQGSNNSTLDGIDVNDSVVPRMGLSMTANNMDSVSEIRVVTNGGKAEYGRNAGAQVELVSRSGTNAFHGNAFDYLRNTVLNANNFFNNTSKQTRPIFIQNIFGGSFGGPIRKDSTFIFGNYQGRRTTQTTTRNRTVMTTNAKAGLFTWSGGTYDIVKADPRGKGIDPQIAAILKLVPDPNNTDLGDGYNTGGFRFNNPTGSMEDQFTIKGDQYLRRAHHLFLRWSWQRNSAIDAINNADATYPGQPQGTQGGHRWGYAIGYDWTITNSMVNEFRIGYQSARAAFYRPGRLPQAMIITNLLNPDPLNTAFAQGRISPVREFTDHLTKVHGRHTIKGGINWRFTTQNGYNDGGMYPNVNLAPALAPVPSSVGPAGLNSTDRGRFDNLYNDLLARMSQVAVTYYSDLEKWQPVGTTRLRNYKFNEYGYFIQDDWKIRRNLTLNLGLRYEFSGVPYETNGYEGTLNKAAQINAVSQISDFTLQRSKSLYNNDYNNFAPRIGFAWDVAGDGRTAVRGSWSIFFDRIIGATTSLVDGNTPGFSQAQNFYPNSGTTDVRVSDGIPVPPVPPAPILTPPQDRNLSVVVFSPNLRTGYVQHLSLMLEHEFFRNMVVQAGYVGTRGIKLFMDVNPNQPRIYNTGFLQAFKELQAFRASGTAVPATNPLVLLFGSVSNAVSKIGGSTIDQGLVGTAVQTVDRTNYALYAAAGVSNFWVRNYPQFNQVIVGNNDGRSYYNSLQVTFRRQTGALKFNANYTFSKSIDNISVDGNGYTAPMDSFNLTLNRARGDYDRPHSFNSSFIYTLPIGKGHRFAGDVPRWLDSVIGGWDVGLLTVWQSGGVMSVSSGRVTGPVPGVNTYANYTGDRNIGGIIRAGNGVFYFTPAQMTGFSYPSAGDTGSSGRNAFRGPRFFNTDASLVKKFKITESHSVSFRAEAYNLFNNANFSLPGVTFTNYSTDPTRNTFGKIGTTINAARVMQMALRYDF